MKFIDEATITIAAGNGGDGIVAWRREKYVPKGGPSGGDGGHGGTIFLEATRDLSTLVEFRYKRSLRRRRRQGGRHLQQIGPQRRRSHDFRAGRDDRLSHARKARAENFLADSAHAGDRVQVAKGGRGGLGNQHFATSTRQAPRIAYNGEPGEKASLRLELRLLADCGIIGVPNAGQIDVALGGFRRASEDCGLSVHHDRAATRRRARVG